MSFDIFFMPCRFGDPIAQRNQILTEEESKDFECCEITPDEEAAVRKVIEQSNSVENPSEIPCNIEFVDGGVLGVRSLGSMSPWFGVTPQISQFLFDVLDAGRWTMIAVMDPCLALTTKAGRHWGIPDSFPEIVICQSADDIYQYLTGGYVTFKKYLDQVRGWDYESGPGSLGEDYGAPN